MAARNPAADAGAARRSPGNALMTLTSALHTLRNLGSLTTLQAGGSGRGARRAQAALGELDEDDSL